LDRRTVQMKYSVREEYHKLIDLLRSSLSENIERLEAEVNSGVMSPDTFAACATDLKDRMSEIGEAAIQVIEGDNVDEDDPCDSDGSVTLGEEDDDDEDDEEEEDDDDDEDDEDDEEDDDDDEDGEDDEDGDNDEGNEGDDEEGEEDKGGGDDKD